LNLYDHFTPSFDTVDLESFPDFKAPVPGCISGG